LTAQKLRNQAFCLNIGTIRVGDVGMRAMILESPRQPLIWREVPLPALRPEQLLVRVSACAVCRTDLHVIDGELTNPKLPLILGHEIVGRIEKLGEAVREFRAGERVGIPWLGWTCGECKFCRSDRENLCAKARFTGYTLDGGYAEFTVADARFCFRIPDAYGDVAAAPLLCAGLIGYRSLRKTGDAERVGIYGFGAAAHIVAQVAHHQGRKVFAFTRPGDRAAQQFALKMGADWAGGSDEAAPEKLDAAIIFAPVGALVPAALRGLERGGIVVCGGIHMSNIPSFPYDDLWQERAICSVANLTRRDALEFLEIAPRIPVTTATRTYPLAEANEALEALRSGKLSGAAVLDCRLV
jgi:propanol-preferring alcohol dehydrogenase